VRLFRAHFAIMLSIFSLAFGGIQKKGCQRIGIRRDEIEHALRTKLSDRAGFG